MPAKKSATTPATPPVPTSAPVKKAAATKVPVEKTAAKKTAAKTPVSKAAPAAAQAVAKSSPASARPTREQIEQAAYFNYRTRAEKGLPGDPQSDWVAAERKLKAD
jgi:hypothetical protein